MFSNVAAEQVPVRNLAIENISGLNLLLFMSTSDIIVILNCTHVDALKLVVIMHHTTCHRCRHSVSPERYRVR